MKTLAISIAILSLAAGPALAQQQAPCFPHTDAVDALATIGEAPVARMLDSQGRMVEVLATQDGSTFTVLIVSPSGQACAVSSGSAFELVPAAAPGKAS